MSRKTRLKVPRLEKPTSMQMSVTDRSVDRGSYNARSTRRRCRYRFGVSPNVARNVRMKCASDTSASRARVGTSRGSAYRRAISAPARSSRRLDSSTARPTRTITARRSGSGDVDTASVQPGQRVDALAVLAALVHLEVQVRAGRLATVTQERNGLPGLHVLAGLDQDRVHVPVDGDVAVLVEDVHGQAEAAGRAGTQHHPVAGRVLRRAHRGREVDPPVEGPPARAEAAGVPGALDRQHELGTGGLPGRGLGLRPRRTGCRDLLQPCLRLGDGDGRLRLHLDALVAG